MVCEIRAVRSVGRLVTGLERGAERDARRGTTEPTLDTTQHQTRSPTPARSGIRLIETSGVNRHLGCAYGGGGGLTSHGWCCYF
jgi:hypothetical protein